MCKQTSEVIDEQLVEDPVQILTDLDVSLTEVREQSTFRPPVVSFSSSTVQALEEVNKAYQQGDEYGHHTGLKALHKIIGGLMPGDVTIVAGRPSMGKTTVGLAMATALALSAVMVFL